MDKPTFYVEIVKALVDLVKALAWPVAFIAVVLMFKDKFATLIDRLKDFDGLGMKASFGEQVKKAEAEVEKLKVEATLAVQDEADTLAATAQVEEPGTAPSPPSFDLDKPIVNYLLLSVHPGSGFQLGRAHLERALANMFYKMTGQFPGLLVTMDEVVERLEEKRFITAKMRRTISELLSLGNQAMTGKFEPTAESARSYVNAVQSTVELMAERLKRTS